MKICFISGPFKPGKCGISDYIKLMSQKLEVLGNSVERINFAQVISFSKEDYALPKSDAYSIQFAPYAFSCAGLSGRSLIKLAELLSNKVTHINFHEIWIGAYPNASLREILMDGGKKRNIEVFRDRKCLVP